MVRAQSTDPFLEERNASGGVTKQFFNLGESISGSSYFYTKDHLGSIREMTSSSGSPQAVLSYDSYGRSISLQGSLSPDFQFSGYYQHMPSALSLTLNRAYDSNLARWISRDPIEEIGGTNLYAYVNNKPLSFIDPDGTDGKDPNPKIPPCITNFVDCAIWCDSTSENIKDPKARKPWRDQCLIWCARRFPVKKKTQYPEGKHDLPPDPSYNNRTPFIVPIPIPGTPWTWPGIPTPYGPLPLIPVPIFGVPILV
jgi:RHS repeat-associated protein